jgi:hypothetical protein
VKTVSRVPDRLWQKPTDVRQIVGIENYGYSAAFDHPALDHLKNLKYRILACGGWAITLPTIEEDLEALLDRGFLKLGQRITHKRGHPSRCHENVARLWDGNPHLTSILTGYALSNDGIWRQHSWLVFSDTGHVIETTEKRIAYFGFVLTLEEARDFSYANS